jgi:hypothetical protein
MLLLRNGNLCGNLWKSTAIAKLDSFPGLTLSSAAMASRPCLRLPLGSEPVWWGSFARVPSWFGSTVCTGKRQTSRGTLGQQSKQNNKDGKTTGKFVQAVAFGDFLVNDQAGAQAADIGFELTRPNDDAVQRGSMHRRSRCRSAWASVHLTPLQSDERARLRTPHPL